MKMHSLTAAFFLSLVFVQMAVGQQPQTANEVVAAVSRNVKEFQDDLPDFVCNERITSTTFQSGKRQTQKVVDSIFSVQRRQEHREILAVDGKPAKKNAKMPRLHVGITGTFGYVLFLTFSPSNLPLHEYALEQKPDEAGGLVVEFQTRRDQQEIKWDDNGDIRVAKDAGKAWIDPAAMQVVRIERNLLNLSRSRSLWRITVEQGPVTIGEKQFWLPKIFRTELAEQDPTKTGEFLAQYSDCKKFITEISIRP